MGLRMATPWKHPNGTFYVRERVPSDLLSIAKDWEAKDTADDLDTEIAKKFRKGYPRIDDLIKRSFVKLSTAQKTKVYDMYARFFRWSFDRLHDDGIIAFVTNRSFIDSRTFDGFRRFVTQEFSEAYVVDLGGDVRANPKLSGTKHNVFGIQTGVAVAFLVKRRGKSGQGCRISYARRPEFDTAEEKLAWLTSNPASTLRMIPFVPSNQRFATTVATTTPVEKVGPQTHPLRHFHR